MRTLGYITTNGRVATGIRLRVESLGLDTSHFRGKRSWSTAQLEAAVRDSRSWSEVVGRLGVSSTSAEAIARARGYAARLGIDSSHFPSLKPVPGAALPFSNTVRHGGQSGLSIAARWFLDRNYTVSVPLEPALYDLVTESDGGLVRVQVKTTRRQEANGRYAAGIGRLIHDATAPRNANGNRKSVPYGVDDIDYFFIITPVKMYLIPISVVAGSMLIVLDEKYAAFAVESS